MIEEQILLSALEPEDRIKLLEVLRSETLTTILGYSATKTDAARAIAHNEILSSQIELTIHSHERF